MIRKSCPGVRRFEMTRSLAVFCVTPVADHRFNITDRREFVNPPKTGAALFDFEREQAASVRKPDAAGFVARASLGITGAHGGIELFAVRQGENGQLAHDDLRQGNLLPGCLCRRNRLRRALCRNALYGGMVYGAPRFRQQRISVGCSGIQGRPQ